MGLAEIVGYISGRDTNVVKGLNVAGLSTGKNSYLVIFNITFFFSKFFGLQNL